MKARVILTAAIFIIFSLCHAELDSASMRFRNKFGMTLSGFGMILSFHLLPNPALAEEPQEAIVLNVRGMACGQCAKRIEAELKKMDGVKDAKVSIEEAKAVIKLDKNKIKEEQLVEAIQNMGFTVEKKKR